MSIPPDPADMMDYGIRRERSDYRLHICFLEGYAYLYRTEYGIEAIDNGKYKELHARQDGVDGITARGYNVPPEDIRACRRIEIPRKWLDVVACCDSDPLVEKKRKAEKIAEAMFRHGRLPVRMTTRVLTDVDAQIAGGDLEITCKHTIQVKCDFRGGTPPEFFGLFIQTHERNPLKYK